MRDLERKDKNNLMVRKKYSCLRLNTTFLIPAFLNIEYFCTYMLSGYCCFQQVMRYSIKYEFSVCRIATIAYVANTINKDGSGDYKLHRTIKLLRFIILFRCRFLTILTIAKSALYSSRSLRILNEFTH